MCFFVDPSQVRRVPIPTGIQRNLNFVSVRTIKGSSSHAGTPREREIERDFERERDLIATHTQDLATGVGVGVCMYLCVCVCVRESVCVCVVCILCVHVCVTAVTYAAHHTWPERMPSARARVSLASPARA
jgi:hypothetical protein